MTRVILGNGESITIGNDIYDVFGTAAGAEQITVLDNTVVTFGANFNAGGDTIRLGGNPADFTIRQSGSYVILTSTSDGIVANIPIGSVGITLTFQDGAGAFTDVRTLLYDGTNIVLDSQIVTSTATAVDPAPSPSAFAPESALDTSIFAIFDESGPAHVGGAAISQGATESGMAAFVVHFA